MLKKTNFEPMLKFLLETFNLKLIIAFDEIDYTQTRSQEIQAQFMCLAVNERPYIYPADSFININMHHIGFCI